MKENGNKSETSHKQTYFWEKGEMDDKKGKVWKKDERKNWWKKNKNSKEIQFLKDGRVSEGKK